MRAKRGDTIWWYEDPDQLGLFAFTFDKKKIFCLFRDYDKMTPKQKAIFDKENPYWAHFFNPSEKNKIAMKAEAFKDDYIEETEEIENPEELEWFRDAEDSDSPKPQRTPWLD